jgi:hypothetical protein
VGVIAIGLSARALLVNVAHENTISPTKTERMELSKQATSRTGRAEDAPRARLVMLLAEGHA